MCFENLGGQILCHEHIWLDSDQSIKEEESKDYFSIKETLKI